MLDELRQKAEEVTTREGCYLYDLEFVGAQSARALRVTIDKDGEGGVTVEDCTKVSRGLNVLLDEEYELEVSSPGLERVLKEPRHFARALGRQIAVKSFHPLLQFNEDFAELGKMKQIQGTLLSSDQAALKIGYQDREVLIPMESVTKAHVVFEFTESSVQKPGKGPKKGKAKN